MFRVSHDVPVRVVHHTQRRHTTHRLLTHNVSQTRVVRSSTINTRKHTHQGERHVMRWLIRHVRSPLNLKNDAFKPESYGVLALNVRRRVRRVVVGTVRLYQNIDRGRDCVRVCRRRVQTPRPRYVKIIINGAMLRASRTLVAAHDVRRVVERMRHVGHQRRTVRYVRGRFYVDTSNTL